jgi:predicted RNA-binding Zn-ribbon protein involved in translation (DUF1610 family)
MEEDSQPSNEDEGEVPEKKPVKYTTSRAAADTTQRSDGRNFYCPKCGNYFFTADERNNHGCSLYN